MKIKILLVGEAEVSEDKLHCERACFYHHGYTCKLTEQTRKYDLKADKWLRVGLCSQAEKRVKEMGAK